MVGFIKTLDGTTRRPTPLHERIPVLGSVRKLARSALFRFLNKLADTEEARTIQVNGLQNLFARRADLPGVTDALDESPYPDLGSTTSPSAARRNDVVLISARFRTGSTALWHIFRNLDGTTAYYEPFNERRWFDPATRGNRTDATHRGVKEYWQEYDGLEELDQYYRKDWIDRQLFMDEQSWNPGMKRFVEVLIDRAAGRPILQFNRIDFRLPWFRHHFPRARLVHLYRHPRDQWCSTLMDPTAVPREVSIPGFEAHDHYYLRNWARDLKYNFPFLDEAQVSHPYQLFYYVWKLSYLFGRRYAHHSMSFEELTVDPARSLENLFRAVGVESATVERLAKLVEKPRAGRWREYAPQEWFQEQESTCERVLGEYLGRP